MRPRGRTTRARTPRTRASGANAECDASAGAVSACAAADPTLSSPQKRLRLSQGRTAATTEGDELPFNDAIDMQSVRCKPRGDNHESLSWYRHGGGGPRC